MCPNEIIDTADEAVKSVILGAIIKSPFFTTTTTIIILPTQNIDFLNAPKKIL